MDVKIEASWKRELEAEFQKPYFTALNDFIKNEYSTKSIYPPGSKIFHAFDSCPFDRVKVVILGQDPYHGPGQAHGLCFSVNEGVPMPPSLVNIFKELKSDLGKEIPPNGNLSRWAGQGVLLLNATLTVQAHKAGSHQNRGWETFTDTVVSLLSAKREGLVFLLWGSYAIKKGSIIDQTRHFVLTAPHPSPLSAHRGFFGSRHFSKTNELLQKRGLEPIDW